MVNWFARLDRTHKIATTIASVVVTVACSLVIYSWYQSTHPPAPPQPAVTDDDVPGLCGWAGEEVAKDELARLKGEFVPFVIWDAAKAAPAESQDKRAVLWDASLKVLGHHIPPFFQGTGDCCGMGATGACQYLLCVQIAVGELQEYRPLFPSYNYGCARVFIGKGRIPCGSAGATGSWSALAAKGYGAYPSDDPDCPSYSGRISDKWGCKPGPPTSAIEKGKQNLVGEVAQVNSWEEVRDALVNGYPVTVASNRGFQMKGRVKDGKLWLTPSGSWAHQMCIIGYDPVPEPCFCILNSWGPDAHGNNPDGPPGSFWTTAKVVDSMVKQGDSFAYAGLGGFKARDVDLSIFGQKGVSDVRVNPKRIHAHAGAEFSIAP